METNSSKTPKRHTQGAWTICQDLEKDFKTPKLTLVDWRMGINTPGILQSSISNPVETTNQDIERKRSRPQNWRWWIEEWGKKTRNPSIFNLQSSWKTFQYLKKKNQDPRIDAGGQLRHCRKPQISQIVPDPSCHVGSPLIQANLCKTVKTL